MKKNSTKISIPDWKFSCTGCGECCRRWHVALSEDEIKRLEGFEWDDSDRIPNEVTTTINGYKYIAHAKEGHCIYLNTSNNMCKIHGRFGINSKPKGCRIYPYNIATTFPGNISVIGRFDCPAVRQNYGNPISSSLKTIKGYVNEMGLTGGFDDYVLDDLSVNEIRIIIAGFIKYLLDAIDLSSDRKLVASIISAYRLEKLDADFLKQIDVDEIIPSFFQRSINKIDLLKIKPLNLPERWRFLNVFISYLRRDEEVIGKGMSSRLNRLKAMSKIMFAKGNLRELGKEHPDAILDKNKLFNMPIANLDDINWSLYINLVKLRLESFQFFGPTYYNLSFFIGLKSLLFSFPLVLAAAKWSAMARYPDLCCILPEDIDYGVSVIDHNLGRSALLGAGLFTTLVRQMTVPEPYVRIVNTLINGRS